MVAEQIEILLQTIDRHWSQAKQSEDQRASLTNYLLTIYGASQAYIIQRNFDKPALMMGVIMVILGIYGFIGTYKYYERFRFHAKNVGELMSNLDKLNIGVNLRQIETAAKNKHMQNFPRLSNMRLNILWLILHLCFAFVGLINIGLIVLKNNYATSLL